MACSQKMVIVTSCYHIQFVKLFRVTEMRDIDVIFNSFLPCHVDHHIKTVKAPFTLHAVSLNSSRPNIYIFLALLPNVQESN